MAAVTPTHPMPSMPLPAPDAVYRLSVHQFDRMVRAGTLDEDEPVELLNGVLVTKMPKNPCHRVGTRKVVRSLERVVPAGWFVQKEDSLVLGPSSKWEPDVAVVRAELEFDASRDPRADECCLVVEVVETNLSRAQVEKLPVYASAGIPAYWSINLKGGNPPGSGVVEVYTDPDASAGQYRSRVELHPGDQVPVLVDGREVGRVAVADLLP
jgi:Uma2 family endonuclease